MKYAVIVAFALIAQMSQAWAEWKLRYDEDGDRYIALSEEVAVRTARDKTIKTRMFLVFTCSPQHSEDTLVMSFKDIPRFSNTKIKDIGGGARSFRVLTALHRIGTEEPKLGHPDVIQDKDMPRLVAFDSSFIQEIRRYDILSVGFGWGSQGDGVTAMVDLRGAGAVISRAQRKCNATRRY